MSAARDKTDKVIIEFTIESIEFHLKQARANMNPGGRACRVNEALRGIAFDLQCAQPFSWPDPEARALEAARRDKALQRTLKKASRKTPI